VVYGSDSLCTSPPPPFPGAVGSCLINDGHRRSAPVMKHHRLSKLRAPRRCHIIWVGPCFYHLARRLRPLLPVLHSETSLPPIHWLATAGCATARAMRTVTMLRACTAAPAGTGCTCHFWTWAMTPSLGLRPKSAHYYSVVFLFSRILFHVKFSKIHINF
jgi:hypothetical protein